MLCWLVPGAYYYLNSETVIWREVQDSSLNWAELIREVSSYIIEKKYLLEFLLTDNCMCYECKRSAQQGQARDLVFRC